MPSGRPGPDIETIDATRGPYTIVTRLSDTTYTVRKLNSNGKTRTYHTNFLKRWESPFAVGMLAITPEEMEDAP